MRSDGIKMGLHHLQSLICTYSADDLHPFMFLVKFTFWTLDISCLDTRFEYLPEGVVGTKKLASFPHSRQTLRTLEAVINLFIDGICFGKPNQTLPVFIIAR